LNEHLNSVCHIHNLIIQDGKCPDNQTINDFLDIVKNNMAIAVHCTAGFGRSPLMVCIALINIYHLPAFDAIKMIRKKINGSLNTCQIDFLYSYEIKNKKSCCTIM
jgi:protein tyrosine phosphatase type 4A